MLILIVGPVLWAVTLTHQYVQTYAPTNVLARRVRCSPPTRGKVVGLPALTVALLAATRGLAQAVEAGAPPWLNLALLILAWDAIKVGCITIGIEARSVATALGRAT